MKKLLLICLTFLLINTITNATSLNPGDIAISSINSDDSDDFSFVLLTSISGTTTIYFTDNGWDDDADGGFTNPTWRGVTEGTITWTFTGTLPCGTEIQISAPTVTATTSHGSAVNTGSFNLSSTADHLLAYTGTGVPFDGTEITNFICAFGLGTAGWTSNATTTTTSALPPGLTNGVDAIATQTSDDNFQYDCSTVSPVSALRTALVTLANYTAGSTNENYQAPGCSYSCSSACTNPDVPTITHNPTTICDGSTTTLTISGNLNDASKWYIYTGSCGGTLIDSTASSTYLITPIGPSTTYFIRGEGNCVTPGSCGQIVVNVLPAKTGAVNDTICNNGNVVVNGTTYNAGNPSGTEVISNVGPNNCDSTVTVNLNILAVKTGTITQTICFGDSIIVNGTTYNTTVTGATEVFTNIGPNMCDSTVTINLTVSSAINIAVTNTAPTLTATQSGATYRWLDCDNSFAIISGETNQAYTATSTGNYAVEITIGNCVDTSACENVMTTNLVTNNNFNQINIFPSPANNVINVNLGNITTAVNFTLTSIDGKVIYQANNVNDTKTAIDISNNATGVYFLKVETNNKQQIFKVVKQ